MKYNVKSNWSLREWNVDGVVKLNNPAHMALGLPRANFSELLRAITPVKMSSSVYLGKSGLIRPLTGKIINSNKALQTHTLAHTHAHIRIHTHTHSPQYTRARTRVCSRATHIHTQNRIRGKVCTAVSFFPEWEDWIEVLSRDSRLKSLWRNPVCLIVLKETKQL